MKNRYLIIILMVILGGLGIIIWQLNSDLEIVINERDSLGVINEEIIALNQEYSVNNTKSQETIKSLQEQMHSIKQELIEKTERDDSRIEKEQKYEKIRELFSHYLYSADGKYIGRNLSDINQSHLAAVTNTTDYIIYIKDDEGISATGLMSNLGSAIHYKSAKEAKSYQYIYHEYGEDKMLLISTQDIEYEYYYFEGSWYLRVRFYSSPFTNTFGDDYYVLDESIEKTDLRQYLAMIKKINNDLEDYSIKSNIQSDMFDEMKNSKFQAYGGVEVFALEFGESVLSLSKGGVGYIVGYIVNDYNENDGVLTMDITLVVNEDKNAYQERMDIRVVYDSEKIDFNGLIYEKIINRNE